MTMCDAQPLPTSDDIQSSTNGAEKHFEFFRYLYNQVAQTWYVRKACDSYNYGKQTLHLENLLNTVEDRVAVASNAGLNYAQPIYAGYVFPATDSIVNNLIIPGVENSKMMINKSKDAAAMGATMSLSLAVVASQVGLIGSAAVTALLLDGIIMIKSGGLAVVGGVNDLETAIKKRISSIIMHSRKIAMVPVEMADDYANSLIDVISVVLENSLDMPSDESFRHENTSIKNRISRLTSRVVTLLQTRTNESLIEPTRKQLQSLSASLQQGLQLIGILKQHPQIILRSVKNLKVKLTEEQFSSSAQALWTRIHEEAHKYKLSPDEVLIRSIKRCSFVLKDYIAKLRQQTNEILPPNTVQHLDSAAIYIEELNAHLENLNGISDVKDELFQKAKQALDEIAHWTSGLILRDASDSNLESVVDTDDSNEQPSNTE